MFQYYQAAADITFPQTPVHAQSSRLLGWAFTLIILLFIQKLLATEFVGLQAYLTPEIDSRLLFSKLVALRGHSRKYTLKNLLKISKI